MNTSNLKTIGFEDHVLRRADGSIDIAAYDSIARGQRVATLDDAVRTAYRSVVSALSAIAGDRHSPKHPPLRNASLTRC